jgi:excisionase family DNA binding protein
MRDDSRQGGSPRRPLLTTRSAADTAACDVVTIRRAIQAGELRALRLGGHGDYRIPVDELDRWLRPAHPESET